MELQNKDLHTSPLDSTFVLKGFPGGALAHKCKHSTHSDERLLQILLLLDFAQRFKGRDRTKALVP